MSLRKVLSFVTPALQIWLPLAAVSVLVSCVSATPPLTEQVSSTAAVEAPAGQPSTSTSQEPPVTRAEEPAPAAAAGATGEIDGGMPRYVKPETPEQRRDRLATAEDPGLDPDPETIWFRNGRQYKIRKLSRELVIEAPGQPGFIRPIGLNFVDEVYQENDKYVWVWMEEIDVEAIRAERAAENRVPDETIEWLRSIRNDYTPLDPPSANVRVRFESGSNGLPTSGNWRNSLAVADMNGDGFLDLVLPPQRAGDPFPAIFLGDGKGNWREWETTWPAALDYGSVAAADFNKDGHMDLAFGVHLSGVAILLGDGKGGFRQVERTFDFPTRRIRIADIDADGWPDVVAITEGPMGRGGLSSRDFSNLRGYLNRRKGESWEGINISGVKESISGDWLTVGNFNGDRYPDFVGSSIYFNGTHTLYLSRGAGKYAAVGAGTSVVPLRSTYNASTAGRFTSRNRDDAIVASFRIWPDSIRTEAVPPPPLQRVVNIDRISFAGREPVRTSIMRWKAGHAVMGLASGDFNGDGHLDIVFTRSAPRELVLLLGDGKGNFKRAEVEGLELSDLPNYDLEVADIDGDGRPDIILMYAAESGTGLAPRRAAVEVWLNRGVVAE
jgi:hypothetical protein